MSPNIVLGEASLEHVWRMADDVDTPRGLLVGTAQGGTPADKALATFRQFYPGGGDDIEQTLVVDWGRDPWAMACEPVNYSPGQLPRFWPRVIEPEGRVQFVGAYADNLNWGMEAATRSRTAWPRPSTRREAHPMSSLSAFSRRTSLRGGLSLLGLLAFPGNASAAAGHTLTSPDGRIEVRVRAEDRLRYDVLLRGKLVLQDSTLVLDVGGTALGQKPRVRGTKTRRVDQEIEPAVRQKAARLRERFQELRLDLEGRYAVVFRAFDEGVAYRFETALPASEVKVRGEEIAFRFAGDWPVFFHREESLFSHNERHYVRQPLSELPAGSFASTPAVVDADGVKLAIADADIEDYPGLWLEGTGGNALLGKLPPIPLKRSSRETGTSRS